MCLQGRAMVSFGSDMHTTHSLVFSSLEKTANKNTIINPGNDGGRAVASLVKIKRGRKRRRKIFLFFFQEKNTHASSGLVPAVGSGDCSIPKISCKMYTTPSTYEQAVIRAKFLCVFQTKKLCTITFCLTIFRSYPSVVFTRVANVVCDCTFFFSSRLSAFPGK